MDVGSEDAFEDRVFALVMADPEGARIVEESMRGLLLLRMDILGDAAMTRPPSTRLLMMLAMETPGYDKMMRRMWARIEEAEEAVRIADAAEEGLRGLG